MRQGTPQCITAHGTIGGDRRRNVLRRTERLRLEARGRCDGWSDDGLAVVGRDDVVDVDVVVELIDLYAVRPGVELGLGSDERSDGKWPVGL